MSVDGIALWLPLVLIGAQVFLFARLGLRLGARLNGIVFGQAGSLVFAADGRELPFAGNSVVNTSTLCAPLSP